MTKSDPRAPNSPWLIPYLVVRDPQKSLGFYAQAFSFTPGDANKDENGQIKHAEMSYKGQYAVMFCSEGAFGGTAKSPASGGFECPNSMYVYCDDVDALCEQAKAAGARVLFGPDYAFWGDRFAQLEDPDGYRWGFATHIASST